MKVHQGISSSTMICFMALAAGGMATSVFGQEIRVRAIRSAPLGSLVGTIGSPIASPAVFSGGGIEVDLQIEATGWEQAAGAPTLGAIQATVVSAGYSNGVGGDLSPKGWPGSPADGAYLPTKVCSSTLAPCNAPFDGTCNGFADGFCIDNDAQGAPNGDFVMPVCADSLNAIATPTLNYAWAAAAQNDCNDSSGGAFKGLGGLILEIPADAAGTYVIDLDDDPNNTFMTSGAGTPIPGVIFTAETITIITGKCCSNIGPNVTCEDGLTTGDCDSRPGPRTFKANDTCDGPTPEDDCPRCTQDSDCADEIPGGPANDACTDDICDVATGICSNPLNYYTAVDCCNPADGGLTTINDGDVCTDDTCNADGTVSHDCNTAPCDDNNNCTVDDTCDNCVCSGTDINDFPCTTDADCPVGICDACTGAGNCSCHLSPCCFPDGTCVDSERCCVEQGGQYSSFSIDCFRDADGDGISSACDNCPENPNPEQADCDGDGTGDVCAIAEGTSQDCNSNGIPDSCDLAAGTSPDCNSNGLPDSCDIAGGTSEDLFGPGGVGGPDGVPDECNVDCDGDRTPDLEETNPLQQDCDRDSICNGVQIDNCPQAQPSCDDCNGNGIPDGCDIADGTSADCNGNAVPDECDVNPNDPDGNGEVSPDCNGNGIPDECEQPDCNGNGIPDGCDLAGGTSLDCNGDGIPDECQPDCNNNGIQDDCDLADQRSLDCNGNVTPDVCDIDPSDPDGNGEVSEDCSGNGIPDECEPDCNGNGTADSCDIFNGTSEDCNGKGVPDECELSDGTVEDCNDNAIPDRCDITAGTSADSNGNGIPDECEAQACCFVSQGVSVCQNLIPSDCEPLENGVSQGLDTACPTENIFTAGHGSGPFTHLTDPAAQCPEGGGRGTDCIAGDPIDPWSTAIDAVMCHLFGVPDSPPLPADFFGPGSDPFTGQVCLEGKPLGPTPFGDFGEADTLVRRTGGPAGTGDPFDRCELPSANQVIVNAEVVALNLESTAPITVTFNGGQNPELWDVAVDLSEVTPPPGSITAVKTHCNGGTYNSELHVQPRFTFTKVADPSNSEVLDTGLAGIPFIALIQDTNPSWTGDVSGTLGLASPICTDFHPAIEDTSQTTDCDCNGNGVRDFCDIEDGTSEDCNENGIPDSCELDSDVDGVIDDCDNCPSIANADQADADGDGAGDLCDPCPNDSEDDADGDGVCVPEDNCPDRANPDQADGDGDGVGDLCDSCPLDNPDDTDGDGACDSGDNCPSAANPDQADADGDLIGDLCDACPNDPQNDVDRDGVCGPVDNCPDVFNPDQTNADGDVLGDACDPCPQTLSTKCACEDAGDCGDGFFCNGQETCEQGICMPGTKPCAPGEPCDEVANECITASIPAVSEWGLVILALLLLAGGKVYFNRRRRAAS